jgi:hypothetical protein
MPDEGSFQQLLASWRARPIAFLPGLREEDLRNFENRFVLRLPGAFREYLKMANGMASAAWGDDLIHFWNLEEIAKHLSEPGIRTRYPFLPFADYSIECWVWTLPMESNGDVLDSVCTYGPPLAACKPSFLTFVESYLHGEDISPKELGPRAHPHWRSG